jgi:hypothetical protein
VPKPIPEDKARQGRWGFHALTILIVSLLLIFIVWGGMAIYGEMIDSGAPVAQREQIPGGG